MATFFVKDNTTKALLTIVADEAPDGYEYMTETEATAKLKQFVKDAGLPDSPFAQYNDAGDVVSDLPVDFVGADRIK